MYLRLITFFTGDGNCGLNEVQAESGRNCTCENRSECSETVGFGCYCIQGFFRSSDGSCVSAEACASISIALTCDEDSPIGDYIPYKIPQTSNVKPPLDLPPISDLPEFPFGTPPIPIPKPPSIIPNNSYSVASGKPEAPIDITGPIFDRSKSHIPQNNSRKWRHNAKIKHYKKYHNEKIHKKRHRSTKLHHKKN